MRVDVVTPAGGDDRVKNGRTVARLGMSDEEPVFLSDGGGADGVFDQVIVYLGPAQPRVGDQRFPLIEKIGAGFPQQRLGKGSLGKVDCRAFEQLKRQAEVALAQAGA